MMGTNDFPDGISVGTAPQFCQTDHETDIIPAVTYGDVSLPSPPTVGDVERLPGVERVETSHGMTHIEVRVDEDRVSQVQRRKLANKIVHAAAGRGEVSVNIKGIHVEHHKPHTEFADVEMPTTDGPEPLTKRELLPIVADCVEEDGETIDLDAVGRHARERGEQPKELLHRIEASIQSLSEHHASDSSDEDDEEDSFDLEGAAASAASLTEAAHFYVDGHIDLFEFEVACERLIENPFEHVSIDWEDDEGDDASFSDGLPLWGGTA